MSNVFSAHAVAIEAFIGGRDPRDDDGGGAEFVGQHPCQQAREGSTCLWRTAP
jgi:hypothetical protein